jgi:hypothetical protein
MRRMEQRITAETPFRETGDTDQASFRRAIGRSWNGRGASPITSAAEEVFAALATAGFSRLGAAICWHETKNATWPQSPIPAESHNPWAVKGSGPGGWATYGGYAAAATAWVRHLLDPNGPYAGAGSLRDLVAIYAPAGDGNDVERYLQVICDEVNALPEIEAGSRWPGGHPPGPRQPGYLVTPRAAPAIYDIRNPRDAERFGLSVDEARALLGCRNRGRNGHRPLAVVWHIQDGVTTGSLDWWLHGSAGGQRVRASATVMANRDGSILRVIPEEDAPWTNGDVAAPTAWGARLRDLGGGDPNDVTLSIEAEGRPGEPLTPEEERAILWQTEAWMERYGFGPEMVGPHAAINSVSRADCPGPYYAKLHPLLKRRDGRGETERGSPPAGPPPVGLPHGVSVDQLRRWFGPEFNPEGPVTAAWAAEGERTGRFGRLVRFDPPGARRVFEFDDGLAIEADATGTRVIRRAS